MSTAEFHDEPDLGSLVANGTKIRMLQTALSRAEMNSEAVPMLLKNIDRQGSWMAFLFPDAPDAEPYRYTAADFRVFITTPRPAGLQSSEGMIRRLVAGTDMEDRFEEMLWEDKKGQPNWESQPRTNDGSFMGRNRDIIPVPPHKQDSIDQPATIPLSTRIRDYSREAKRGTSVSYALRRLGKQRPDLLEKVKQGDLSAHAAMVLAGFTPKAITIPDDPANAARRLGLHFRGERLRALIENLERIEAEQDR
jgi:hypothetical protein